MKVKNTSVSSNVKGQGSQTMKLVLDVMTLDILCKFVLTQSRIVRMSHLVNLRHMIVALDPSTYENDPDKQKRVAFIMRALEARIDHRLNDRTAILVDVNGGLPYDVDFLDYNHLDLSVGELNWANDLIAETIQYSFLYRKMGRMQDLFTRFNTSTYQTRGTIAQEIEQMLNELKNDYRRSRIENNILETTFSLSEGIFENVIGDVHSIITNPSRRLRTMMYAFNEMIGGGFENGRVYGIFGNGGVGKSLTMLNIAVQIKKANVNYKTKDPTKKPAIAFFTMENTLVETITRLFDMTTNSPGMSMADFTVQEVIEKMRTEGQMILNDASPIDIIIKYKPNRSVDTSYLYTLCDDLEDQGYEVIMVIQDHLKRIRSIYGNSELRIELGDIINEFKVFAAEKDIPLLTDGHLNRDAARMTEENASKGNRVDIVSRFGKSTVGESMLILDNLDCGINIMKDYDEDGNSYMVFGLSKMRDKTNMLYFAQPFSPTSPIRLVEDVDGIPVYKETLHNNPNIQRSPTVRVSSASAIANLDDIDNDNAFTNISSYNLTSEIKEERKETCPIYFFGEGTSNLVDDIKRDLQMVI